MTDETKKEGPAVGDLLGWLREGESLLPRERFVQVLQVIGADVVYSLLGAGELPRRRVRTDPPTTPARYAKRPSDQGAYIDELIFDALDKAEKHELTRAEIVAHAVGQDPEVTLNQIKWRMRCLVETGRLRIEIRTRPGMIGRHGYYKKVEATT